MRGNFNFWTAAFEKKIKRKACDYLFIYIIRLSQGRLKAITIVQENFLGLNKCFQVSISHF